MQYQIVLKPRAVRDLSKLSPNLQKAAAIEIDSLKQTSRPVGAKKLSTNQNLYRICFKYYYRIIYKIDDEQKVVEVERIRHRSEAYRKI